MFVKSLKLAQNIALKNRTILANNSIINNVSRWNNFNRRQISYLADNSHKSDVLLTYNKSNLCNPLKQSCGIASVAAAINASDHLLQQNLLTTKSSGSRGMKIYTKTGDRGTSSTLTGQRFPKHHQIFQALGAIDELSAHIGLAKEFGEERKHTYTEQLERVQCLLQDAASAIALATPTTPDTRDCTKPGTTPSPAPAANNDGDAAADAGEAAADTGEAATAVAPTTKRRKTAVSAATSGVSENHIEELESWIDNYSATLPKLTNFILPGGGRASAGLHIARTICRRAEREVVALLPHYHVDKHVIIFINRLSDYLFTIARVATAFDNSKEVIYINPTKPKKPKIKQGSQVFSDV